MTLHPTLSLEQTDRGTIAYAFDSATNGERLPDIDALKEESRRTFRMLDERPLTADEQRLIRDESIYVIPAYNEGIRDAQGNAPIEASLRYLREHGVPPERVTVMNCADKPEDKTGEIARAYGVNEAVQSRVISALVDKDKLLDLMQSHKIPYGKGLTLTTASAHLLETGVIGPHNENDTHVVYLDADPQDYGIGKYDPLSNFARLRVQGGESLKPAKSRRNNQPVYVGWNAAAVHGPNARFYQERIGRIQWQLSGEMSRTGRAIKSLAMHTGYPVETTMNMSDAELHLRFMQYADGPLRSDGNNPLEKETVMYTQILRTVGAIIGHQRAGMLMRAAANGRGALSMSAILKSADNQPWTRLIDFEADDVRAVNGTLAEPMAILVPNEKGGVPQTSVDVVQPFEHRLLGTMTMLSRERIVRLSVPLGA